MTEHGPESPSGKPALSQDQAGLLFLDYDLPAERIAQEPVDPRDSSRLLVVPRNGGPLADRFFRDLPDQLRAGDLVVMNASYQAYHQKAGEELYGSYPLTHVLVPAFMGFEVSSLHLIERLAWWLHIVGILLFLNYIPCSKHFHIMMAFPNTYFTRQRPKGYFPLNAQVKQEVALMLDPGATAPAAPAEPQTFGAKDIFDLSRKNLMDAYTCTECGRCTSECPANLTGKKLSPRKIMMDTRDRMEEVGAQLDKQKKWQDDGKTLHDRISAEELWACTSCNACVQACPVNINPLDIILKMRQYLVMEQSQAPEALMAMFTNIENNGAPWPMSASDRFNWAQTGA
ncbi:MAG: S-adenosylmethionine:tRNA ribosyltransferase-isomerase [Sphingobacteriia bacterium]